MEVKYMYDMIDSFYEEREGCLQAFEIEQSFGAGQGECLEEMKKSVSVE